MQPESQPSIMQRAIASLFVLLEYARAFRPVEQPPYSSEVVVTCFSAAWWISCEPSGPLGSVYEPLACEQH